jgi:signal transduction histidine kinase/ActR/RegA family two-component response regulator
VPWTTDAGGAFVAPQPQWAAYTEQSWNEMRGFGWANALHPDDRAAVLDLWRAALERGDRYESTGRVWHANTRTYRHFVARAAPLRRADGRIREWVGTCTDCEADELREREREELLRIAERARGEAESASRAKDEFLAVLSHELRSPLNAMLGWLHVLRAASGDPLVVRAVETIERNLRGQTRMIEDLLDISRIVSGKLELERAPVELAEIVQSCVESLRPGAAGKHLTLELESPHERLVVEGDGSRLQQVIGNLLHNAVKFTPQGGRVSVRLHAVGGFAQLEVEDSGQGMDAALLARVFDKFVQSASSTTRRHGGLGLGLAIVQQLVVLHGGTVHAESDGPDRGARFTVRLPLAVDAPVRMQPPADREGVDTPRPVPGLDVLLVDDDADTREVLALALGAGGMRVRLAASAREALREYELRAPDVILSDLGMPDEDGYALIRAIRARENGMRPRAPAIAMTGFASRQDQESALRAGFDEHLAKPVDPDALLERIWALAGSPEAGMRAKARH